MDFTIQYTREQEDFRKEVRDWLEQNARYPSELGDIPPETDHYTDEMKQWGLDFTRKLGEKGWLFPLWDKEYGGGGLTADHDIIIREELDRYTVPEVGKGDLQAGSIAVHGTDEQKKRFLSPILRGEAVCWQLFTEPNVGSDLASLQTQAISSSPARRCGSAVSSRPTSYGRRPSPTPTRHVTRIWAPL
jgi:alkylation response protein AidB-like acyl-CoA dehydrogenase